jgi:hypothetical protein
MPRKDFNYFPCLIHYKAIRLFHDCELTPSNPSLYILENSLIIEQPYDIKFYNTIPPSIDPEII